MTNNPHTPGNPYGSPHSPHQQPGGQPPRSQQQPAYGSQPTFGSYPGSQQPHPHQQPYSMPQSYGPQSGYGSQPGYGQQPGPNPQPTYGSHPYAAQTRTLDIPEGFGYPGPDGKVPANQPYYGIGPFAAYKRYFKNYVRFNGFASRGEFWWPFLFNSIITFLIGGLPLLGAIIFRLGLRSSVHISTAGDPSVDVNPTPLLFASVFPLLFTAIVSLLGVVTIIPTIAVSIRRLHDAGFTGWLYLLTLLQVGHFVILALCLLKPSPNRWEPSWFDR